MSNATPPERTQDTSGILKQAIEYLCEWLRDRIGISDDILRGILREDNEDWIFVIKLHSLIEAALNHAIIAKLNHPSLSEIITHIDIGDRQRGKMAYVKALNILSEKERRFINMLSTLRNEIVHDVKNLDFTFSKWLSNKLPAERKNFRECVESVFADPVIENGVSISRSEYCMQEPRLAFLRNSIFIMVSVMTCDLDSRRKAGENESLKLELEVKEFRIKYLEEQVGVFSDD